MRTGRVTSPVVEAAMDLEELVIAHARRDGVICGAERKVIDWCRKVIFLADRADSSLALFNAGLAERGIDSPHFERRLRETRVDRLRLVEPVTDDQSAA